MTMNNSIPDDILIAIASGDDVSLDDITDAGVDINSLGNRVGRTPMMAAAFAGRCSLIKNLVENGATLDRGNEYGVTSLHEAAAMGHEGSVKTLLELGANIEAETKFDLLFFFE